MQNGNGDPATDRLVKIFENGELLVDQKFDDIRARANVTYEEVRQRSATLLRLCCSSSGDTLPWDAVTVGLMNGLM